MNELTAALQKTKEECDARLAEIFASLAASAAPKSRLLAAMQYSVTAGGKRLRPFLVAQAGALFDLPAAWTLEVGAAIEVLHTYSLIHDDLPAIDNDDLRRGLPTCHKQFDEATAILAGDGLLTLAFEIVAGAESIPERIRTRLTLELARSAGAARGMLAGEMFDILLERQKNFTADDVRLMQAQKTGALFHFACVSSALMAEEQENGSKMQALTAYAQALGLLFQITDDLLDATGDEKLVGKKLQKDAASGKANWVDIYGVEQSRKDIARLVEDGQAALAPFAGRARLLADLLDYIAIRQS